MQAGKLRERITIRQRQATTDALGQPSTTWTDLAVVWAEARFVSGIETIKAGRETSTSRASVRIRNMTELCGRCVLSLAALTMKSWTSSLIRNALI
jgi:Bacteriophage head-tail adaptor